MNSSSDMTVFLYLIPVFIALGIYLIIYSKKKSGMIKKFASKKGLEYKKIDDGSLEKQLSASINLEENGLVRNVCQIKDIITNGDIALFRCVELLDLVSYKGAQNTHFQRIAITFRISPEAEMFFHFNPKTKEYHDYFNESFKNKYFPMIKNIFENSNLNHTISLTMKRGMAFIYYMPLITGGEKEIDLNSLMELGMEIKRSIIKI